MMFSRIISRVFDPFVCLATLFTISALRIGMTEMVFIQFLLVFFFGMVVPPIGLLWWAAKTKRVTNYDLSDRKERVRAMLLFFLFLIIDGIIISMFFPFPKLQEMFLLVFLFIFGFFLVTLKWKISYHMASATLVIGIFFLWYGRGLWPIVFILPLLAWARVKLKRHTMGEVIGGTVYGMVALFVSYILKLI